MRLTVCDGDRGFVAESSVRNEQLASAAAARCVEESVLDGRECDQAADDVPPEGRLLGPREHAEVRAGWGEQRNGQAETVVGRRVRIYYYTVQQSKVFTN